jgi:hypothetical protein
VSRPIQVSIDCAEPGLLALFWTEVLKYQLAPAPQGFDSWEAFSAATGEPGDAWSAVVDPAAVGPRLLFHRVPEGKVVKNRVHLDVLMTAKETPMDERRRLVDAEVPRLMALGATHVRTDDDGDDYYAVMQDPEGNEFCVG